MGVPNDLANAALRLSLGCLSTPACVTRTVDVLATLAEKSRGVKSAPVFETVEF
jgi:cysteine desulfurase